MYSVTLFPDRVPETDLVSLFTVCSHVMDPEMAFPFWEMRRTDPHCPDPDLPLQVPDSSEEVAVEEEADEEEKEEEEPDEEEFEESSSS